VSLRETPSSRAHVAWSDAPAQAGRSAGVAVAAANAIRLLQMTDDAAATRTAGAALLALQAEDLHLDQLAYRRVHLPARTELAELAKRQALLELDRQSIETERSALIDRQDALESEIAESDQRLRSLDERSQSGVVTSFRDQEALAVEMGAVSRRKRDLEDQELEIMEQLEPHDAALAAVLGEKEAVVETRRLLESQIVSEETEIAAESAIVTENRISAAEGVAAGLLSEYERLRDHLGGIGVARIVQGTCSGCNLHLSATELDRIHHLTDDTLEHCEQCGRLLVP
jgi:predicted  nucleic acid-binding Zn-ribbon protein